MKFSLLTRFLFLVGGLLAGACAVCPGQAAQGHSELVVQAKRTPAPDFTVTDLEGQQITLSKYRGQVVLLDFWAVNCGGCRLELPWYVEFDSRYRRSGLALIGLDMYGESPDLIKPFAKRQKMEYPVAIGTDELGAKFGSKEMPLTLLIDRKGRVAESHAGVVDRAAFERDVQMLLKE